MKTYSIVGSSGLIGSNLAYALSNRSDRLNLIDINNHSDNKYKNSHFEALDITTKYGIERASKLVKNNDALFFKAGVLGDGAKSSNSELIHTYLDTNFSSLLSLMERCNNKTPKHIIIDSSIAAVAKKTTVKALTEHDFPLSAMNFYGLSKLALEEYGEFISRELNCKITIFRYPRVHSSSVKNIIWYLVHCVTNNKTIELTGNPDKVLDFVHIDDVIKANIQALNLKSKFEILHVTSGEPITLLELSNMVVRMYGKKDHPILIKKNAVVPAEPLINHLNDDYSKKVLKTTERIGVNQMIIETFNSTMEKTNEC